jgi:hypothetical protein
MITCKLLLCAQGVVRDADSGNVSVFNIMENIQAAGFPFFIQQMVVFALFERLREDSTQYEILFRLSMGTTELFTTPLAIDFQDKLRNRTTLHIRGLVVPQPGVLRVSAELGDTILGTYEVRIDHVTPPRVEAQQVPAGADGSV